VTLSDTESRIVRVRVFKKKKGNGEEEMKD
jgi:hypothetical protein